MLGKFSTYKFGDVKSLKYYGKIIMYFKHNLQLKVENMKFKIENQIGNLKMKMENKI